MISKKIQDIKPIHADEDTEIRQIFHPHNTLDGIRYSLAQSTLQPGKKSKLHKMKTSEVYFVLEGKGVLHIDGKPILIEEYQSIFVPPFSLQYLENTGSVILKVLCIVDPAWKKDDEVVI
ncbi:cupin domain-containing protein [Candidatus Nitrosopelagicus sp.]|nr:cupin domain-containing protein [Candidatus Nitrosopelagicus sp.]